MTQSGLGASIMPSAYAGTAREGPLVVKQLQAPVVSRDISFVSKRGRSLSPAAQALADVLHAHWSAAPTPRRRTGP
jgi:DNA-binding transcriptional LysR family regulator